MNVDGVNMVVGAEEKFNLLKHLDRLLLNSEKKLKLKSNINEVKTFVPSYSTNDRTRSFLKVQDGCDYHCTFCTIPKARGSSRSQTIQQTIQVAKQLGQSGTKEIVLTGVNIGDFGSGSNESFYDLIVNLDKTRGIERFRISSIEPNLLSNEIIKFCAKSKKFMPHFHIPLQSGSDNVLGNMRRRYSSDTFMSSLNTVKSSVKNVAITTDVIVGFPGETRDDFKQTRQICLESGFSDLHVFKFSRRPGTSAFYVCDDVSPSEKSSRSSEIIEIGKESYKTFRESYEGSRLVVLWEGIGGNDGESRAPRTGLTENYIRVKSISKIGLPNSFSNVTVKIDPENVYGPMFAFEGE